MSFTTAQVNGSTKKQIKVKDEADETLDLVWTVFVLVGTLIWRLVKWIARHIIGIAALAFLIENLILFEHFTHFVLK